MSFLKMNPFNHESTKSSGLARYIESFFSNLMSFFVVNILFLLSCIPIITVGPALVALSRISCLAIQQKNISPIKDYWHAFKHNIKQGLILSFSFCPLLALFLYLFFMYLNMVFNNIFALLSLCVTGIFLLMLICITQYLFPLVACMNASVPALLKDSFILCFTGWQYTAFSAFSSLTIFIAGVLLLPKSLPLFVFIYFSFVNYNSCFFSWKIIDRYIFQPYYRNNPNLSKIDGYSCPSSGN